MTAVAVASRRCVLCGHALFWQPDACFRCLPKWRLEVARLAREYRAGGLTVAAVAELLGCSRSTAYRAATRHNAEGVARDHACRRCAHEWRSRALDHPLRCPSCRSTTWRPSGKRRFAL